jgi:hypothetical protein
MRRSAWALAILLLACGPSETTGGTGSSSGSGGASACPNDLPASCPSPAPGYAKDVAPVIQARCLKCHSPGGVSANKPLVDYASVYKLRISVLDQLFSCKMPLAGSPAPSLAEREAILGWLVCGAKDD